VADQKFSFKKPWLFGEYEKMQTTIDEAELYLGSGIKEEESQFKKPYLAVDHPASENKFNPPGEPVWPPGPYYPPSGPPGYNCQPAGQGIGGGALNPCVPQMSCGQWAWTCAHRITKFGVVQNNGHIQSVQYQANDVVVVTVCWDEGGTAGKTMKGTLVTTDDGAVWSSQVPLNCLGPGADPLCTSCLDCVGPTHTPNILYTSQQMQTGGTQDLSATLGGGGPYTWQIISGGGTLATTKTAYGEDNLYTAPATNANCSLNPTIKVTDYCGNSATLKLAINQYSNDTINASDLPLCTHIGSACNSTITHHYKSCSGTVLTSPACGGGTCDYWMNGTCCGDAPCTYHCNSCADISAITGCPYGSVIDVRTALMKTQGCCPVALL
jgi:hypothetical protein